MEQVSNRYIPWETIEAILLRLPVKSLGRFKSVSKEWNSIISDPIFIKTYNNLSQPTKKLIAITSKSSHTPIFPASLYSIELTIDNDNYTALTTAKEITFGSTPPITFRFNKILGSCNGLVLASGRTSLQDPWALFLTNPTTLNLCKLPLNPFANYNRDIARYGFGYDSSTDDYKVVSFCPSYRTATQYDIVSIYSLRNNSWRELPDTPHHVNFNDGGCALVNGNCHWLATSSQSIIAFGFVDELISEIKAPDSYLNHIWYESWVVEIGGRLGVYLKRWRGDYELWVMQEYGDAKSWTRVFSHGDFMWPLCMLQGSDRVIVFADGKFDGVGLLNIDDGRRIRVLTGPVKFNVIRNAFVESIESPKRFSTKVMERVTGQSISTKACKKMHVS